MLPVLFEALGLGLVIASIALLFGIPIAIGATGLLIFGAAWLYEQQRTQP